MQKKDGYMKFLQKGNMDIIERRYKRMSLWFLSKNFIKKRSPQQRTNINEPELYQRTSFCIRQSGSYSIEAAVVIPLITGFLVTILSFFRILQVQCCIEEALLYAGRKTAVESSVVESEELLFLSAEAFLAEALHEEELIDRYVENGVWGIQLWKTRIDSQMIHLNATYVIRIPILFWDIGRMEFTSQNSMRRWNASHSDREDVDYVYITPTGEVYHATTGCRVLDLSIHKTDIDQMDKLRGKNGQKYDACTRCALGNKDGKVYYTDYGTRFHKDLFCSFLKRTIDKIPIEEIGTRRPCSYCY